MKTVQILFHDHQTNAQLINNVDPTVSKIVSMPSPFSTTDFINVKKIFKQNSIDCVHNTIIRWFCNKYCEDKDGKMTMKKESYKKLQFMIFGFLQIMRDHKRKTNLMHT